jgi:hypothetical protein
MVSSCATRNVPIVTEIERPRIDQRILRECLGPVKVPKRELKKSEIVELYNKNYDRLVECKYKHKELKKQLIEIEKQIQDIVETI